jgi:hypothetical protein
MSWEEGMSLWLAWKSAKANREAEQKYLAVKQMQQAMAQRLDQAKTPVVSRKMHMPIMFSGQSALPVTGRMAIARLMTNALKTGLAHMIRQLGISHVATEQVLQGALQMAGRWIAALNDWARHLREQVLDRLRQVIRWVYQQVVREKLLVFLGEQGQVLKETVIRFWRRWRKHT